MAEHPALVLSIAPSCFWQILVPLVTPLWAWLYKGVKSGCTVHVWAPALGHFEGVLRHF